VPEILPTAKVGTLGKLGVSGSDVHIVPGRMEILDDTIPLYIAVDTENTLIHLFC